MKVISIISSLCALLILPLPAAAQELLRYKAAPYQKLIYEHRASTQIDSRGLRYVHQSGWTTTEQLSPEGGHLDATVVFSKVNETISLKQHSSSCQAGVDELIQHELRGLLKGRTASYRLDGREGVTNFTPPKDGDIRYRDQQPFESTVILLEFEAAIRFPELPDQPLNVKDEWSAERTWKVYSPSGQDSCSISYASTYRVKKAKKSKGFACFEIEGETQISTVTFLVAGQVSFVERGSGKVKVKFLFDYERGLIQKYEAQISTKNRINALAGLFQTEEDARSRTSYKVELKSAE